MRVTMCLLAFITLSPRHDGYGVCTRMHVNNNGMYMTCLCCTPVPHSPSGRIRIGRNPKGSTDQVQKFKRELRRPMLGATYINVNIERKRGNERLRHEGPVPESYIRYI